MKPVYYMACSFENGRVVSPIHKAVLLSMIALKTPAKISGVNRWIEAGVTVMIDSGVFETCSAHARKRGMGLNEVLMLPTDEIAGYDKLREHYIKTAKLLKGVDILVELDFGGMESKKRIRAELEAEGLTVTPVCHPLNDGWDYLDELAEQYPKVCIGNIVNMDPARRVHSMAYLTKWKQKHPDTWIHLLGMTPNPAMVAMPMDSCDSSSWTCPVRWFAAWRSSSLYNRSIGKFDRDMAHLREGKQHQEHAVQIVAVDEHCSALGLEHYSQQFGGVA